ncbi:transposase [Massilia sp. TW-1]|uniref:Transposase n=1 Tax=Telluria antibiotica TaxID=2717319 RepID=A0ABX0PGN2_9BURK|nr:transposase [Telluria antibiotica]
MKRFIEGEHRGQGTLLPALLDDYVSEDNPVRVVDVFVEELNLAGLGFKRVQPAKTGRPAYHPAVLLKLYIYGYLNRIQSSRRLEREAQRNVDLMWLTQLSAATGTRLQDDRQEPAAKQAKAVRLNDKIAALKDQMAALTKIEAKLQETGETQISLTDPDARSMMTRGSGIVGYNVQTAVDTKHHLIVEHDVTNNGSDRDQLSGMAKKARTAIGTPKLTAIADRGYFKGEEILACHEVGISALVPKVKTSNAMADGRFDKADFIYDPEKDEFRCPAGQALIWRFASIENGLKNHRYWSSNCKDCPLKTKCTPSQQRGVTRWEHQDVLDDMQTRLYQSWKRLRLSSTLAQLLDRSRGIGRTLTSRVTCSAPSRRIIRKFRIVAFSNDAGRAALSVKTRARAGA